MLKTIPEFIQLASKNVRKVTAEQAFKELSQSKALLIDVRESAEFSTGKLMNAINIPRGILEMRLLEQVNDPNAALYLHCATAGRATLAAESLHRLGYENVSVIMGKFTDLVKTFNT